MVLFLYLFFVCLLTSLFRAGRWSVGTARLAIVHTGHGVKNAFEALQTRQLIVLDAPIF